MASAATPAIRARGLVKRFGALKAVAEIDLDVPRGMIFAYPASGRMSVASAAVEMLELGWVRSEGAEQDG